MKSILTALLAVLALGLVACGDDDEKSSTTAPGETGGDTSSKLIEKDPANASKKQIVVGSKNFAEQYILGEIYAQSLEAAGYKVKTELDQGSEQIAFKALKSGQIDAYPEYAGTVLTSFYKVKTADVPPDAAQAYAEVKEQTAGDEIEALPQTSFENTYRLTSTKEVAEKYGNPKTISELVQKSGDDVKVSGFPECRQRTDCFVGLKQTYDWNPKFV